MATTTAKKRTLRDIFTFNSHRQTERFAAMVGILVVALGGLMIGISGSAYSNGQKLVSQQAIYNPEFRMSKTGASGDVVGVFVNTDRTRTMLLMKFDDTSKVSINAKNYQSFLTGATPAGVQQGLKSDISNGEILSFGTTGYLGVVLESPEPFKKQVMSLTMRANSELVYRAPSSGAAAPSSDNSFQQFDQWRTFFNPAASAATVTTALDGESYDVAAVFNELVIVEQEELVRAGLDEALAVMQTDLTRIEEFKAVAAGLDLEGLQLVIPPAPDYLRGDVVTGSVAEGTLVFEPNKVLSGGFDFDWRSGSVFEGYVDDLLEPNQNYLDFFNAQKSLTPEKMNPMKDFPFSFNDGSLLSDHSSTDAGMKQFFDASTSLTQAYQTYNTNKNNYQVTLLGELLSLELDLRLSSSVDSINNTEEAVLVY